jgi:hypothetical protein
MTVQRAEKAAKERYRGDAVCVHILKRSGEEIRVGSHWSYESLDAVALISRLVDAFQKAILSMQFAQAVTAEARALTSKRVPAAARAATLKRLARRHCAEGQQTMVETLASDLANWAEGQGIYEDQPLGLDEVARWILLARFIASGGGDEE